MSRVNVTVQPMCMPNWIQLTSSDPLMLLLNIFSSCAIAFPFAIIVARRPFQYGFGPGCVCVSCRPRLGTYAFRCQHTLVLLTARLDLSSSSSGHVNSVHLQIVPLIFTAHPRIDFTSFSTPCLLTVPYTCCSS
jgi:hypothetical protein